jgi:hypothetical protein
VPLNYFQDAVVPHFDKGESSSVALTLRIVQRHNIFWLDDIRHEVVFIS